MAAAQDCHEAAGFKRCPRCRENKSLNQFHYLKSSSKHYAYCRPCAQESHREWRKNNKERHRENCLAWQRNNPDAVKRLRYPREYGISYAAFLEMIKAQGGRCAICRTEISSEPGNEYHRRAVLDHCHTTGAVRGALCYSCNTGIGLLQDSPEVAEAAALYLRMRPAP